MADPLSFRGRHGITDRNSTARKDANDDDGPGVEVELQPHAPVADS